MRVASECAWYKLAKVVSLPAWAIADSFSRGIERVKWHKAIPWQIVTRKVTENGLGTINTGSGRGWAEGDTLGSEVRTRASCVTDVQQVAFLGTSPSYPLFRHPVQAEPPYIKSFLNVLTLAVWLLFDRYRPCFNVRGTFLPWNSLFVYSTGC